MGTDFELEGTLKVTGAKGVEIEDTRLNRAYVAYIGDLLKSPRIDVYEEDESVVTAVLREKAGIPNKPQFRMKVPERYADSYRHCDRATGQPGVECGWELKGSVKHNNVFIEWDAITMRFEHSEWLDYIIKKFIEPKDWVLNGTLEVCADGKFVGSTILTNNKIIFESSDYRSSDDEDEDE
jgi:hypothetical protein